MKECRWLAPQLVGQFEFLESTEDGHLRLSKFIALRGDKERGLITAQSQSREPSAGFSDSPSYPKPKPSARFRPSLLFDDLGVRFICRFREHPQVGHLGCRKRVSRYGSRARKQTVDVIRNSQRTLNFSDPALHNLQSFTTPVAPPIPNQVERKELSKPARGTAGPLRNPKWLYNKNPRSAGEAISRGC